MSRITVPATKPSNFGVSARTPLRWYVPASGLLNAVLLVEVVHRYLQPATPINHGLARVLVTALCVNLAVSSAILWLAVGRHWTGWLGSLGRIDIAFSLLPFAMAALRNGDRARVFHLFALVYVLFLLAKMAELLSYAGHNASEAGSRARVPVVVFAAAFIVYGGTVPWMALASAPQGDEAHFMILTHSIVFDHDFDVGDNYRNGDYKEQYPPPSPGAMRGYPYASMQRDNMDYLPHEPHVVRNYRGQLMLQHDPGFPLLLVPGYALDLREGALFTMAVIAALGAAAVFQTALLLGAGVGRALMTVALFCFSCPYWVFTQSVLSDLLGGVGILWIGLQFFCYRRRERDRHLLLAGVLIAILPWLNIRWWSLGGPAFLVLTAWVIAHDRGMPLVRKLALLGVPSLIGLGAFAAFDKIFFNTYKPNASMLLLDRVMPQFQLHPIHGLLGMMFDQSYGLLPTAPLYVAVAAGLVVLYRRDRWAFAMLFLPALGYLPFVAFSRYWFAGWNAPARYMISALTLMIPAAALVLNRRVRWIVALLAAWSLLIAILFTVNPYLRIPSAWVFYRQSMLVEFFHDHIHTPMYSILSVFPNMMQGYAKDYARGCFWLVAFIAAAWGWSRTAERAATERR